MNVGKARLFNRRRIAATVLVIAAGGFAVRGLSTTEPTVWRGAPPLSTGLSPCDQYPDDLDALIQKHLPGRASVSITESTGRHPSAVRIVGDEIYHLVLDLSLFEPGIGLARKLNEQGAPTVHRSVLSRSVADQVTEILSSEIALAQADLPPGRDGAYYYFRTAGESCAITWSPGEGSRARYWVQLFDRLAERAQVHDPVDAVAKDREILEIISVLRGK